MTGNEAIRGRNIFKDLNPPTTGSEDSEEADKTQLKYKVRSVMRRMVREDPFRKIKEKA